MEKQLRKSPYAEFNPDKRQGAGKEEVRSALTEEELLRNAKWSGPQKEEPRRYATIHSLQEARARKLTAVPEAGRADTRPIEAARVIEAHYRTREDIDRDVAAIGKDSSLNTLEKNKLLRDLDIETEALVLKELQEANPVKEKHNPAEAREALAREDETVGTITRHVLDERMKGSDAEQVRKILVEQGISPWTPEAEVFLKTWNQEKAEQALAELAQEREQAVMAANEAEPKKRVELKEYQGKHIEAKFKAFAIDVDALPKELKGGFETLTYGQRLLLAENLEQLTLGRIQEEAKDRYQKETSSAILLKSKLLGKAWHGISKKYQIAKHEQATANNIKHGGLQYHGELLKQLIEGTKRTGFDAVEGKDGKLEVQYVEAHPMMDQREKESAKEFNRIATQYGKVPYEWSLTTATSAHRQEYARAHAQFERAKETILGIEENIIGDKNALLFVSGMENKIRLNQFFNTHPDAEKQLESIESHAIWKKTLSSVATERGIYFGAGLAVRSLGVGILGAVGLPLVAVGMGGWMARRRAAETLREREKEARQGTKDISKEARSVTTAHALSDKLESLVKKVNTEDDDEKRQQYLAALQVRLEYTKNKLDSGLVDFGSADRRIVNQYGLMDTLTVGSATLIAQDMDRMPEASTKDIRREHLLGLKEAKTTKARQDYLRKQMIYGAGLGIGFFAAGYYAKDVLHGVFSPNEAGAAEIKTIGGSLRAMEQGGAGKGAGVVAAVEHVNAARATLKAGPAAFDEHLFNASEGSSTASTYRAMSGGIGEKAPSTKIFDKHLFRTAEGSSTASTHEAMPGGISRKGAGLATVVEHTKEAPVAIKGTGPTGVAAEHMKEASTIDKGAGPVAAAVEHAKETVATGASERGPIVLDIGKRGPEGAFIDELKKHPEIAARLGIKNIGKEAHTAWAEFAKAQLKEPHIVEHLKERGFTPDAKGYAEMMQRIDNGKIVLEESGGKLHMRIDENTEYLQARPKPPITIRPGVADDIPTRPQILDGSDDDREAALEQFHSPAFDRPADVLSEQPIVEETLPLNKQPINVDKAFRDQPIGGIMSVEGHVDRPTIAIETLVENQFGMDGEEYVAIKSVQVETLLKQIPSRDEAWAIWRGEVPGKEIALPHDGIYGAMEFKKHIDLAEHIREARPDADALRGDVDAFMKNEMRGKGFNVFRDVPESEARPASSVITDIKNDIPTRPQIMDEALPTVKAQPVPVAAVTESVSVKPQVMDRVATTGGISNEAIQVKPQIMDATPRSIEGLASERAMLLSEDIYRSRMPVMKIIDQYKTGKITGEDFANYYSQKVDRKRPSMRLIESMRQLFKLAAGEGASSQRVIAQEKITAMVRSMQGIK